MILSLLANAWTGFSPLALVAGLGGIGMIVVAFLGLTILPGFLKRPLIGAGLVLLTSAAIYQAGTAKGAHDAFALEAARALRAEQGRTAIANQVAARDRAQAVEDLATAETTNRKLQELADALRKDPDRDRVCVDRGIARRLRAL